MIQGGGCDNMHFIICIYMLLNIFMHNFCLYDVCYHLKMDFSSIKEKSLNFVFFINLSLLMCFKCV